MKVFTIRVIYKSGYAMDFDATDFSLSKGAYSWSAYGSPSPVMIGADDIAAVWVLNEREVTE
jgi:hypothetical protein